MPTSRKATLLDVRFWRAPAIVALTAGAVGMWAPAAWGFEASLEVIPSTLAYYGPNDPRTTRTIEERLRVTAGPQQESVVFDHSSDPGSGTDAVLEGPGTLVRGSTRVFSGDDFGSPGRDGCPLRGFSGAVSRYELTLLANTTTTVVFRVPRRLARAPLPGSEPRVSVELARTPPEGPGNVEDRLPGSMTIASPPLKRIGLTGATLVLRAGLTGAGKAIADRRLLLVKPRRSLRISGFLAPARRGDRVTIWDYAPGATRAVRLAVVRVDHNGRFRYLRWRPAPGISELYATWHGRPGLVEQTRSPCGGPQIDVTSAVGDGKPKTLFGRHYPPGTPGAPLHAGRAASLAMRRGA